MAQTPATIVPVTIAPAPAAPAIVVQPVVAKPAQTPATTIVPVAVATVPVVTTPAAAPAEASGAVKHALDAVTDAIKGMQTQFSGVLKRIDGMQTDINALRSDRKSDYDKLSDTVQSLKQDVSDLKNRPAGAAQPAARPARAARSGTARNEAARSSQPRRARQDTGGTGTVPGTTAYAQAGAGPAWELRAAQPGRAWVSKPGTREMQSVAVGESLAGLGRVTAIVYQNGLWTVQGTAGQIRQ